MRNLGRCAWRSLYGIRGGVRRFNRDERGIAAVEFGLVAVPFLGFCLALMGVGLQFLTMNALEHGTETAARLIRTGQAQLGDTNVTASGNPLTLSEFRQKLCDAAGTIIKCDSAHLSIIISSTASWATAQRASCTGSGNTLASPTGNWTAGQSAEKVGDYSGSAGDVVTVTVCYSWDWTMSMLLFMPTFLSNNAALIQAGTAFRTEPY